MENVMNLISIKSIKYLALNKRDVCIFVGAGASIMSPSCLPSFQDLNSALLSNLYQSTSIGQNLQSMMGNINTKPEQLLQIIWDYTNGQFNPVECFQYTSPNRNHHLIAELVAQGVNCIVTPNFDPCLEKALEERQISFNVFNRVPSTSDEANLLLESIKKKETLIWKPHGDCREPQTLCYTREKVAKLSNSRYLWDIFSYIIENYHLIFLGYSGYDDDFFPILYEMLPNSKKKTLWNAYKEPTVNMPCLLLQKKSPDNFHLWIGNMTELLDLLAGKCDIKVDSAPTLNWLAYLEQQFSEVKLSKKKAILAKYLNDFGLFEDAKKIWKEGLSLPKNSIVEEDKLRFQMNLGIISQRTAYDRALKMGCYYIAEIALENLIQEAIDSKSLQSAQYFLKEYRRNCKGAAQYHFIKSKYYFFLYICELDLKNEAAINLQTDFDKAYHALWEDGEILDAIYLMVKHYGAIAALNQGNPEILDELILKINQLIPYGDCRSIANAYYCIANLAISLGKNHIALTYHQKCIHMVEFCYVNGIYQGEQYHELCSYLYHQGSLIAQDRRVGVEKARLALSEAEILHDEKKKIYIKGAVFNSLCSMYMRNDYKLAVKYGMLALEFGKQSGSLQNLARTYTYLAVADAKQGLHEAAIRKFRKSYVLHKQIHEGLNYLYSVLSECKINISEIESE